MRAVILAGGKGKRLRPFTFTIPKPLVPIGDRPIVEILIRQLAAQGFERITISVGHLAPLVESFCGSGEQWGVAIDYLHEDSPLGTIGCLGLIDDIAGDRLLVVNGDTLTDLNMADVYAMHAPSDAITVCANRRYVEIDFGVLEADADGSLRSYTEKPTPHYTVSMGINVISTWTIDKYVARNAKLDLPELIAVLMRADESVRVFETEAYWLDLGRVQDLEAGDEAVRANPDRFLPQ
jgi:NDP-sugar pyrophosphorylase family protein